MLFFHGDNNKYMYVKFNYKIKNQKTTKLRLHTSIILSFKLFYNYKI